MSDDCCDGCGEVVAIELLDGAPPGWRWRRWLSPQVQHWLLLRAADRGVDFSVLLCRDCYGSGWSPLAGQTPLPTGDDSA